MEVCAGEAAAIGENTEEEEAKHNDYTSCYNQFLVSFDRATERMKDAET